MQPSALPISLVSPIDAAGNLLAEHCAPEIAENVIKLAQNSTDFDSFFAQCAFFVKAPKSILEEVWNAVEQTGPDPGAQTTNDSEAPAVTSSESAQNDDSAADLDAPNSPDREWYDDDFGLNPEPVELPVTPAFSLKSSHTADTRTHIFYIKKSPPFINDYQPNPQLVSIVKDPTGSMALQAKQGSTLSKQYKIQRERKKHVKSRTTARGTLKAIDSKETQKTSRSRRAQQFVPYPQLQAARQALPAYACRDDLLQLVRENQVVIVVGETGSGKTTQLPQYLLEDGYSEHGLVGCTQPRRVATMSVAERVAAERGSTVGSTVGYTIRFEDRTTPQTRIKFLTAGVLLREVLVNPRLDKYSCIIIDEAHERTLDTDILLGVFKLILANRRDLKVIVTSATINASLFSRFFGGAPIYTIPGRTYPVHVQNIRAPVGDYVQATVKQVLSIHMQSPPGDILVFMTGQDDIQATCDDLQDKLELLNDPPPLDILPLYSQLPADLQAEIFLPSEHRKVIVSTNVAETSLTVDGIKYVVDSGFTKTKIYQPRYGIDTLQLTPISRANAAQRAGRAGRTSEGYAYRIYTKSAEDREMFEQPVPEIRRTNLSNTVLMLKSMGIEEVSDFDFLDPPDPSIINVSLHDLWVLGALNSDGSISDLGRRIALFPMDPFMARMLIASIDNDCSSEMLTIVAMMSTPSVYVLSSQRQKEADRAREKFQVPESDHLTLLNVYNEWVRNGRSAKWCQENFLQLKVLNHARDIRAQLERLLRSTLKVEPVVAKEPVIIRKCVCMAYFHQAARAKGLQSYVGISSGVQMSLHPTSALYGAGNIPDFVVYHEVIMTSTQFMTVVTSVEPEWLLEYGSIYYSPDAESGRDVDDVEKVPKRPTPTFKRKGTKSQTLHKKFMRGV